MTGAMPSDGLSQLSCEVLSVQADVAFVRDQLGRQISVRRDIQRSHGRAAEVGERWMIDRTLGNEWTFAAIIGANTQERYLFSVANAAERDALTSRYVGMTVYRHDTSGTESWDGTAWLEQTRIACSVRLSADVDLSAGDTPAQSGWSIFTNDGFTVNVATSFAFIEIIVPGQYDIDFHANSDPLTGQAHACKVMWNSTNPTAALATDARNSIPTGEGTWLHAHRNVFLGAGSKLYWQTFGTANYRLKAAKLNVPTRVEVRRVGGN